MSSGSAPNWGCSAGPPGPKPIGGLAGKLCPTSRQTPYPTLGLPAVMLQRVIVGFGRLAVVNRHQEVAEGIAACEYWATEVSGRQLRYVVATE